MSNEKFGLQQLVYEKITNDVLKSNENNFRVLILDQYSAQIISSCCKTYDLIAHKIAVIENLEKKRKPLPDLDAIYLLKPDKNSINQIKEDFDLLSKPQVSVKVEDDTEPSRKIEKIPCVNKIYKAYRNYVYGPVSDETELQETQQPDIKCRYRSARIFFIGQYSANLEEQLNQSPAGNFIKEIKRIDFTFYAIERQVFTLNSPDTFKMFYQTKDDPNKRTLLDKLADQIVGLCLSLNENPTLRFKNAHNIRGDLVELVQHKLDKHAEKNNLLGHSPTKSRSQLLILDRSFDAISPLLHEFTYQAMAYDLADIKDNKYTYKSETDGQKEIHLDETDDVWLELRHKHVSETSKILQENFKKFKEQRSQLSNNLTVSELAQMVKKLPQFQKEINAYTMHMHLTDECFTNYMGKRSKMSLFEQNEAMGVNTEGEVVRDFSKDIVDLLLDADFDQDDKIRIIMIFLLNRNGVTEDKIKTFIEKADISDKKKQNAVFNLSKLGLEIIKDTDKPNVNIDRKDKKTERENVYKESRWTPLIKDLMENIIQNKINNKKYPVLTERKGVKPITPVIGISARDGGVQARKQEKGPTLIVFILGGVTYSEIRSAYEVQQDNVINKENWQIYIGSDQIISPKDFINNLSNI